MRFLHLKSHAVEKARLCLHNNTDVCCNVGKQPPIHDLKVLRILPSCIWNPRALTLHKQGCRQTVITVCLHMYAFSFLPFLVTYSLILILEVFANEIKSKRTANAGLKLPEQCNIHCVHKQNILKPLSLHSSACPQSLMLLDRHHPPF